MKTSAQVASILVLLGVGTLEAQSVDVPLTNWTVPPYMSSSASGGITTMTDISAPRAFTAIAPCRIADTRGNGFTGQAGPPALTTTKRTFQISGTVPGVPTQCGIPQLASAVSFQFTIVAPSSAGNLVAYPAHDGAPPTISVLNWNAGETALGNGTIVPLSSSGHLAVQINALPGATGHLIIDVNGYFSSEHFSGSPLLVVSNSGLAAIRGDNPSSEPSAVAVQGVMTSATPGAAAIGVQGVILSTGASGTTGVRGVNNGTGAAGVGVWGSHGGSGWGVYGEAPSGIGVYGKVPADSGAVQGVLGDVGSLSLGAAGVFGRAGGFSPVSGYQGAGVRGQSSEFGVLGISPFMGVGGSLVNGGGVETHWGALGHLSYGVYAGGGFGGTGAKHFIDPHPTEADKVIRYISLEGPEPGTYFRGRGKFERGMARIAVPDHFRMVTDEAGLTVQITPIGGMASVGVLKADLNEVVVQSSRNLEFYYTVNGIRRTHSHLTSPIGEGREFMPRSADETMPLSLTDEQKRLLVQNGTYREDGTVNLETARRLGWDRAWAERERPSPRPE